MPTVAFIVKINLDDLSSLPDVTTDIEDDLSQAGYEVVDVAPWSRPAMLTVPTTQPTTTQQPIEPTQ